MNLYASVEIEQKSQYEKFSIINSHSVYQFNKE